jgi:hypothetical protein
MLVAVEGNVGVGVGVDAVVDVGDADVDVGVEPACELSCQSPVIGFTQPTIGASQVSSLEGPEGCHLVGRCVAIPQTSSLDKNDGNGMSATDANRQPDVSVGFHRSSVHPLKKTLKTKQKTKQSPVF